MLHLYLNSTCIPSFQHTFNLMFDTHSESRSHRKEPVSGNAGLVYTWIGNNFIPGVPLCLSEPSSGKTGNSIRVWDVSTARFTKNTAEETSLFPRDLSASFSLCLTPTLSLHRARPLWERRYKSVFTSHDAIVSRSGERIVTRNFLSAIIHALCWNISFPIFLFFSTLPFSLLCTSAVDKCYCVDTLKRALFRNFLFLCLCLSASFSLWLIFWRQGFSNDDKVSSLVVDFSFIRIILFSHKYTGCLFVTLFIILLYYIL